MSKKKDSTVIESDPGLMDASQSVDIETSREETKAAIRRSIEEEYGPVLDAAMLRRVVSQAS